MGDSLLPPNDPPIPAATPPAPEPTRGSKLICEFCQSTLAPNGDVLRRGQKATEYMAQADQLAQAKADLTAEQTHSQDLERDLQECRGTKPPAKRKAFLSLGD